MKKYGQILLAAFVAVFFPLRAFLCYSLYPEMQTCAKEWDGANNLTMDIFAAMFFCLSLLSWLNTKGSVQVIIGIALGFSAGDVFDRMLNINDYTAADLITILLAISIPIYTYVTRERSR